MLNFYIYTIRTNKNVEQNKKEEHRLVKCLYF